MVPMFGDKRATQVLLLVLCLIVVSLSQIGVLKAIYISEDGNIEGTDKIQREENLYTLTDNIYNNTITVLKDDVVIDGTGHILRGQIVLLHRNNVTIKNFAITTSSTSDNIFVWYCSNCIILNNTITPFVESYPGTGIDVWGGASHIISGNQIMNNLSGIHLGESTHNNSIFGNKITNNTRGVHISRAENCSIYNNNFNNKYDIFVVAGQNNSVYDNNYNYIIPEFPSWTPLLIMMIIVTLISTAYRRSFKQGRRK